MDKDNLEITEETEEIKEESVEDTALEEAEETVEETDEESEAEEDEDEEERVVICPNCHKNTVGYSHKFCRECEKKIIKVRVPFPAYIAGLLSVAVSVFAFMMVALISAPSLQVIQGDMYSLKQNWFSAYQAYAQVDSVITKVTDAMGETTTFNSMITTGANFSMKAYRTIVKLYNPLGAYQYKANVFSTPGGPRFMEKSRKIAEYDAIYDDYYNTYTMIQEPIDELYYAEEPDAEMGRKTIEAIEKHRNDKGINEVYFDYLIYNVAGYCGYDSANSDKLLDAVREADVKADEDYLWLYGDEYVSSLVARDREDEAMPLIEQLMEQNRSSYNAANQLARIYAKKGDMENLELTVGNYCKQNMNTDGTHSDSNYSLLTYYLRVTGDLELAMDTIDQAEEYYSLMPDFDRQRALIYLLQGKYDEAYEACYNAEDKANYRASYYGDQSAYTKELFATVYLSTYLCKKYGKCDTENAEHIDEIIESFNNLVPSDTVQQILDGKLTIEDALTKGVCDLA